MGVLLEPGKYVVAVSGGVDSAVLLDMLSKDKGLDLVVAHFDHGIREDSDADADFVGSLAKKYKLKFFSERAELGKNASEATARKHRYEFLRRVLSETGAEAIVTAHHHDDLIETALLNVLRGTKRLGLVSLNSKKDIRRPLLKMTKDEIKKYAEENKLNWHEDSTNSSDLYKRNKLRAIIQKTLTPEKRQKISALLHKVEDDNVKIDKALEVYFEGQENNVLNRPALDKTSLAVAYEIIAAWLRRNKVEFNKDTLQRIAVGSRTLTNGSQIDVAKGYYCVLSRYEIVLKRRESV